MTDPIPQPVLDVMVEVQIRMKELQKMLMPGARLTFLARNPEDDESDLFYSNDSVDDVIRGVQRAGRRERFGLAPSHDKKAVAEVKSSFAQREDGWYAKLAICEPGSPVEKSLEKGPFVYEGDAIRALEDVQALIVDQMRKHGHMVKVHSHYCECSPPTDNVDSKGSCAQCGKRWRPASAKNN